MVLRSEQQQQGQSMSCELGQEEAGLWNDLLPRLQQMTAADTQSGSDTRTTDSRLGQGEKQTVN